MSRAQFIIMPIFPGGDTKQKPAEVTVGVGAIMFIEPMQYQGVIAGVGKEGAQIIFVGGNVISTPLTVDQLHEALGFAHADPVKVN